MAFGTRAMMEAILSVTGGTEMTRLTVVGGSTRSPMLMQLLADVLGCRLDVPGSAEATLVGGKLLRDLPSRDD